MTRYKLVAFSNPVEGRDEDYVGWYRTQHLPDIVAMPGVVSGELFTSATPSDHSFMAIYEVETDDLGSVLAEMNRRAGTDLMPITDALDQGSARLAFWKTA